MFSKFILEQTAGVTIVFAIAVAVSYFLRKHSAASRHFVWWLAILAALLVPVASFLKPAGAPTVIVSAAPIDTSAFAAPVDSGRSWTSTQAISAAWLAGFALFFARLIAGLIRASERRHSAIPSKISVPSSWAEVRLSDRITVPETFGLIRPVILLPVEASEWADDRVRVVLAHELVHIERRDWFTQLLAQFSACVYWFHPLAWWALAQLRKERELACDDGVLRLGYKNSEYAQHLVDVARGLRSHVEALSPSVAMACRSQLESRVLAILNPAKNRGKVTTMMKVAATICAGIAIVFFSSVNGSAANAAAVSGTVTDPSGSRVPKALVLLNSKSSDVKRLATTAGEDGEWAFREVAAGEYDVEVRSPGFRPLHTPLTVAAGQPARLAIQLDLGSIQETVTVEAQAQAGRPSQPGSATTPQRIRVGGNVQAAKLLYKPVPVYPPQMKQAGVTGNVIMQAVIGKEGDILNLEVLSPEVHPDLIAAAVDAVKNWSYEPTKLNGENVEVVTMINVNFTLSR
jgi:TonB family protein